MKKLTILALLAILLIGLLVVSACKAKEATPDGDTNITVEQQAPVTPATPAPADTNTVIDDISNGVQEVKEGVQNIAK